MTNFRISIDAIKAGLIERIDELVPQLFPNAVRNGHEWVMGDIMGSPGSSLSIRRTGHKAGWWKDFSDDRARGDILTLFAAGACDGDLKAAIPKAIEWLGLGHLSDEDRRDRERQAARLKARRDADQVKNAEKARRRARGLWHSAQPIAGTPADRYLLGRGIDIRALAKPPGSLRFALMRCPEFSTPDGEVLRPCMVACVIHPITLETIAIHRTFLHVHPDGRVTKADEKSGGPMKDAKRALGEYAGGFIPLARGASGAPIKEAPQGEALVLSEGIEDGLSVALAAPEMRVGAALSLSNIGGFLPPTAIACLWIAGQRDTGHSAIKALDDACARLRDRGVMHRVVLPPADLGVKDWNDWLRQLKRPPNVERGAA